ncbi:spore germination protein [Cohnella abietis]|uniref:Spore germination protein n=1 Tax=Cohnella abietis TaxID=2507935 RepID=A0A3T1DER3_9BACL|nr:spore germination protein [Cohnella abietis]BBI36582.1 spore germination protein [Cohnella abietis]
MSDHSRSSFGNPDVDEPNDFVRELIEAVGHPPDFNHHPFALGENSIGHCLFIETLVDTDRIENLILRFIAEGWLPDALANEPDKLEAWKGKLPNVKTAVADDIHACIQGLLDGRCLLIMPGVEWALMLDVGKTYHRPVDEPKTETTVRGSHEAYNEDMNTNIGLLRKRIRTRQLRFEEMKLGTATETKVVIAYMQDLASSDTVEEFRKRLRSIQSDGIIDCSYVEQWIEDKTLLPFPMIQKTERPDVTSSHLLEGRVIVLVDGSPYALIGPITFWQFFSSPEDYFQRADIATLMLWIRFLAFVLAVFVPALYIAVTLYQQALIPPMLLVSLSSQKEGVPFPSYVEAFLMTIIFEVLREAGLRMPRVAGQAISIVGALVLGEAAVQAGLVSAAMVIVVAITAISNFVAPYYNFGLSQRFLQYAFMLLAGFMGLFGILCGFLLTVVHLASLKSFGVPYLAPVAPVYISDWKDILIRIPRPKQRTYPRMSKPRRRKR